MGSLVDKVEELERAEILEALRLTHWVKARAARRLGITERMIGYKIKKYGIDREVVRERSGAVESGLENEVQDKNSGS
jgi:Nif-specific regulatory protein